MKKYTIGVLIGNANSDHVKNIMNGMTTVAEELNINLIFYLSYHMGFYYSIFSREKPDVNFDYQSSIVFDYALIGDVDAIIFTYGSLTIFLDDKNLDKFIDKFSGIPYVIVEDKDKTKKGSSVINENYEGMYRLAEHLAKDHGYRRFTYLDGPAGNRDAFERRKAFDDVMNAYDIRMTDDMYEEGDYSANVHSQVERLIDAHPDLQCMVCANDLMARTAYEVLESNGYEIGVDVAVTGFDDEEISASMRPPLTTVLQNDYDIAYEALNQAVNLIEGGEPQEIVTKSELKIRVSCGCKRIVGENFREDNTAKITDEERYVREAVDIVAGRIIETRADDSLRKKIVEMIRDIVSEQYDLYHDMIFEEYDASHFGEIINEMVNGKYSKVISVEALENVVSSYVYSVMERENDPDKIRKLSKILAMDLKIIHAANINSLNESIEEFQNDNMYMPLISRDMMNHMNSEEEFYRAPLKTLAYSRVRSAYIVITEKPIQNRINKPWEVPKKMYLASMFDGENYIGYRPEDRPVIRKGEGLLKNIIEDTGRIFSVYGLFLSDKQYGMMIVEIDPEDQLLMHHAAMQISIAIEFKNSYEKLIHMRDKLEQLVDEVREKNKILGFISEMDQLTGILNRRGFVENFMQELHESKGKYGLMLLGDLDHLKQINDWFGHTEGDYAIQACAMLLEDTLGEEAMVARFGGDEFAVLITSEKRISGKILIGRIKEACREFNEKSSKAFYIEISMGYCSFVCNPAEDLDTLIKKADVMLYEVKRDRRDDVRKDRNMDISQYTDNRL